MPDNCNTFWQVCSLPRNLSTLAGRGSKCNLKPVKKLKGYFLGFLTGVFSISIVGCTVTFFTIVFFFGGLFGVLSPIQTSPVIFRFFWSEYGQYNRQPADAQVLDLSSCYRPDSINILMFYLILHGVLNDESCVWISAMISSVPVFFSCSIRLSRSLSSRVPVSNGSSISLMISCFLRSSSSARCA